MLAAQLYGKNDLRIGEVESPKAGADEVLLQVASTCICGTDVRMVQNGASGVTAARPLTLGHELSGVIAAVGEEVDGLEVGNRVAVAPNMGCGVCGLCVSGQTHLCEKYRALGIHCHGGLAERVLIPAAAVRQGNITTIPDSVSFAEAALVEPLSCALNAFDRADIQPGDSVLVIGAGPIGMMHCRLALAGGAGLVMLNDLNDDRLAASRELEPRLQTVSGSQLEQPVKDLTEGRGVDVVITACPAPSAQQSALSLAAINGRIIFFGGLPKDRAEVALNTNLIHYRQLIVTGNTRSSLEQYRRTMRMIATRQIKVHDLITQTSAIDDTLQAVERAARGEGLRNEIRFNLSV